MIKKTNIFLAIGIITTVLNPGLVRARGGSGWGAFGGALVGSTVGTAIVGSAAASNRDRAARRDYYTQRQLQDVQAINYEHRLANQRLSDENQRLRETIQSLNERMNAIEYNTPRNRKMKNSKTEMNDVENDEYSY